MALIQLLESNILFFLSFVAVFSLAVGSFLNVVIHRLPIMMQSTWREQCTEFLAEENNTGSEIAATTATKEKNEKYNLMVPRSACPKCGHQITALENITVVSYMWLKGRCANCQTAISKRYPISELMTAILSVLVAWRFGFSWECLAALFLTWSLIALSIIDFDHFHFRLVRPGKIQNPFNHRFDPIGCHLNLGGDLPDKLETLEGDMVL